MDRDADKRAAALAAADRVREGMTVGLGTGSTARYLIEELGRRVAHGLSIRGVPTSRESEELARRVGISLPPPAEVDRIDLAIDGADEIDPCLRLIKGGGGALLREKIVASFAEEMVVIADARKRVETLGAFPLPVEVVPFAWEWTARRIAALGAVPSLRRLPGGEPFRTDNGNRILDCSFGKILDPEGLAAELKRIPGVVEHGLFLGLAGTAILGDGGKVTILTR